MQIIDLGLIGYRKALDEQLRVHSLVVKGDMPAAIILCSHYPVITCGRSAHAQNLLLSGPEYIARGIDVVETQRGGDVTYHGPGQLVAYPIFPMAAYANDLRGFLRSLEHAVIAALEPLGVIARSRPGLTGVWVGEKKIASIGISVRRWISFHGFSLVVKRGELENFGLIRPCGLDISMTSVESELEREVPLEHVKQNLIRSLDYDQCNAAVAR